MEALSLRFGHVEVSSLWFDDSKVSCTTLPRKSGWRNVSVAVPGCIDRLVLLCSQEEQPLQEHVGGNARTH
jgi:hypothetical protein